MNLVGLQIVDTGPELHQVVPVDALIVQVELPPCPRVDSFAHPLDSSDEIAILRVLKDPGNYRPFAYGAGLSALQVKQIAFGCLRRGRFAHLLRHRWQFLGLDAIARDDGFE